MSLDFDKPVHIYDDRSKSDTTLLVTNVLFINNKFALCKAIFNTLTPEPVDELLLINLESHEIMNSNYFSWVAYNSDASWIEP